MHHDADRDANQENGSPPSLWDVSSRRRMGGARGVARTRKRVHMRLSLSPRWMSFTYRERRACECACAVGSDEREPKVRIWQACDGKHAAVRLEPPLRPPACAADNVRRVPATFFFFAFWRMNVSGLSKLQNSEPQALLPNRDGDTVTVTAYRDGAPPA